MKTKEKNEHSACFHSRSTATIEVPSAIVSFVNDRRRLCLSQCVDVHVQNMHSKFAVHTIFFCMILKNLPRVFLVSTPGCLRATQRATRDRFLDELGIAFSNCCSTTVQKGNIDCAHSPIQRDSENIPAAFFVSTCNSEFFINSASPSETGAQRP